MFLPFTEAQFFEVFRHYNTAIWPAQVALTTLALVAVAVAASGKAWSGKVVAAILAVEWAWTAIVYHWLFFRPINPAAGVFAALWLAGALAFAWSAAGRRPLAFRAGDRWRIAVGGSLVAYALIVYPLLGALGGRVYPAAPTFGAPCPVAITTIGILWLARPPLSRLLLIAPVLWAVVGSAAAFSLGVLEDLGLLVAGLSALVLTVARRAPAPTAQV
jgi:hypothetical protein